ncbi:hypothetical protein CA51_12220 [Rosistilla oblonga]|uniref:hypothetical protein n=1 Tax=Rosistilla oblonga TaxID=2527990 RepID=UPI001188384F|nr:hypothetical protein [Rosistilla oblonga]QDV11360.1 hypothetical protein CA51_12220 [Rosistilla oblonga]
MIARTTRKSNVWLAWASSAALAFLIAAPQATDAADLSAKAGIDGRGRAGMWAECRIEAGQGAAPGNVIVASADGDGVGVDYTQAFTSDGELRCYFQVGRDDQQLKVSITDESGETAASANIDAPAAIPFEKEWILAIGDAIGIEGASEQQGRRNFPIVSVLPDGQELPHHWIAYDGVDLIVFPGSQGAIVNALADSQKQALADWVRRGGRMVLTLGGQSQAAVAAGSWIRDSLGLQIDEEVVEIDPRAIESFTTTQTPLKAYEALRLPSSGGRTLLTGRTLDRQTVPIAKEYLVGFGRVLILAADLDQEPFASWSDRQNLLERFLPNALGTRNNTSQRHTSAAGYTDLVGQIRRTIDQFDSHWVLPFKWLAGFFVLYLGLIGPLDYWIVNRWLGRPLLGWITFPLAVLGFAGLAFYGTTIATPTQPVVNQFSVVDIDPSEKVGRGFAWTQLLSGSAGRNDLRYTIDAEFSDPDSPQPITGWWGVNGQEFGGLTSIGRDRQMPDYTIAAEASGENLSTAAIGLPMPTAATKGLAAWWQFEPRKAVESSLKQRPGTDLLSGSISNPLSVDLMDGLLVYRGWAYLLPTRFTAGKRIPEVSSLTSKNLKWRLTRRSVDKASTATEPWNPEMQGDLDRLLEIAMFYDTAGGPKYTELSNRIVNHLDLSHVLATDNAILLGRVDTPVVQLDEDQHAAEAGTVRSFARILLPVETGR